VTLLLLGTFVILAVTRYAYPRRFREFLLLPLSDKYFKLQGKGYEINHPFNVLLFVVQLISFSLFAYFVVDYFDPAFSKENPWLFVQIITGLAVFILAKYFLEKIIAHIFNIEGIINAYLYEKLNYASIISLFLLVVNILFYFAFKPTRAFLIVISIGLAVVYLISLISCFKRNWRVILRDFSYFILYLCALEIAPYIIVYHLWG
jgi:hypothetical protein